jgi:uncharacterized SAM-binding protein YcdF (DUF218 family)
MLYLIKFLYQTILMPPGIFIILLLIASAVVFRKGRRGIAAFLLTITMGLYFSSAPLFSNFLIRSLESKHSPPTRLHGDVIIMLGGGATLDTPGIGGFGHLSGFAASRLLTTAQLYRILHVPVIVSGGQVYQTTGCEAEIAKAILTGLGVPEEHIIMDKKSLNTTENAVYTAAIIKEYNFREPILVTSAFHMERSVRQFEKTNLRVTPYPTNYLTNVQARLESYHFWPSANALLDTNLALKEYLGIFAAKIY